MPKSIETKRQEEKQMIKQMINLYCRKKHHQKQLCYECQALLDYANMRIDCCPFIETKTFCSACKVHCYQKAYRDKIREVMRFAGPRMLFVHPILATKHLLITLKSKKG